MKCESCGKRLKKSDEVCPECGRYISREKTHIREASSLSEVKKSVFNENEVVFSGNLPLLIFKLCLSVALIGIGVYTFINGRRSEVRDIIFFIASILILVDSFLTFFKEKGCILTFEKERVHGTVPSTRTGKKEIDIRYDEILKTERVMGSKYTPAHISVLLKTGNNVKIPCTRNSTLSDIEELFEIHLTELKISTTNATVIYNGETVEGELINGKEYTLVEINEDGMYELIDESGETGFYYPEFFETTDSE